MKNGFKTAFQILAPVMIIAMIADVSWIDSIVEGLESGTLLFNPHTINITVGDAHAWRWLKGIAHTSIPFYFMQDFGDASCTISSGVVTP